MIQPRHPDVSRHPLEPWESLPAIGYWRVPVDPVALAEAQALVAGNGRARLGRVVAYGNPDFARWQIDQMHVAAALPDPEDFVDFSWSTEERARVAAYLRAGAVVERWFGTSPCRICGCENGSTCLSDGVFVWPAGFAHYVEVHAVRPPPEFVAHALRAP